MLVVGVVEVDDSQKVDERGAYWGMSEHLGALVLRRTNWLKRGTFAVRKLDTSVSSEEGS